MIEYNKAQIGRIATKNGFVRDTFEKVLRLKEILKFINEHEYLREHILLKGGTAINLTIFNLPRLSVDIDMDFVPNYNREVMGLAREKITQILKEYMSQEGYQLSPVSRFSFSLDALHFQYQNAGGNRDSIKVEINYSLRTHILEPVKCKILTDIFEDEMEILTLAPMEIFSAKANALMSRAAARDLYDFNNMEYYGLFGESERDLFRKCIIFYNTISQEKVNKTFDTSAIDTINFSKIKRDLFPVLRKKDNFDLDERKQRAKKYIKELMIVTADEMEFMNAFENKEYKPELLFDNEKIIERLKDRPMAMWKMNR